MINVSTICIKTGPQTHPAPYKPPESSCDWLNSRPTLYLVWVTAMKQQTVLYLLFNSSKTRKAFIKKHNSVSHSNNTAFTCEQWTVSERWRSTLAFIAWCSVQFQDWTGFDGFGADGGEEMISPADRESPVRLDEAGRGRRFIITALTPANTGLFIYTPWCLKQQTVGPLPGKHLSTTTRAGKGNVSSQLLYVTPSCFTSSSRRPVLQLLYK